MMLIYWFLFGLIVGLVAQLVNVQFTYDGESSIGMIISSFIIMFGAAFLYIVVSVLLYGVIL